MANDKLKGFRRDAVRYVQPSFEREKYLTYKARIELLGEVRRIDLSGLAMAFVSHEHDVLLLLEENGEMEANVPLHRKTLLDLADLIRKELP